jgi:adenylylsulfate kinase-like enzyme
MYAKAFAGEIKNFTGVSDPYEAPENAEIHLRTDLETEEESAARIIAYLEEHNFVPVAVGD